MTRIQTKDHTHTLDSTDGNRNANDNIHSLNDNKENYGSSYLRIEHIMAGSQLATAFEENW